VTSYNTPNFFPIEFDLEKRVATIAELDEADYEKSIFILAKGDGRGFLHYKNIFDLTLDEFLEANKYENKDPYFIFHHGFCCSTLLSRMIEARFKTISLREPPGINVATNMTHNVNQLTPENDLFFRRLVYIHGRTFQSHQRAIVKCSDYATRSFTNFISPNTKALFLYSDLVEFIASCSKEKRDFWIANRVNYQEVKDQLGYKSYLDLNNTQIQATLYWCSQISEILACPNLDNVRSLNMSRIFSEKNLLKNLGRFFNLKEKYFIFKDRNQNNIRGHYSKTGSYEFSYDHRMKIIQTVLKKENINCNYFNNLAIDILGDKFAALEKLKL